MSLLQVQGIYKSYGSLPVLQNISLEVQPQERHVIIGPNGAGKTTLFNAITGVIPIDAGSIVMEGKNIGQSPAHARVASGMARTFQKNNLFENLTLEENLELSVLSNKAYRYQILRSAKKYTEIYEGTKQLLDDWDLWNRRKRLVKELSYGEQRLLELLLALALKPRLLMLDEPTSGMSPAETRRTIELIQSLPKSIALLVVEHDMEVVFSIADRITVLHHGEVFLSGKPEEIRGHEKVTEIYFGGGAKHAGA